MGNCRRPKSAVSSIPGYARGLVDIKAVFANLDDGKQFLAYMNNQLRPFNVKRKNLIDEIKRCEAKLELLQIDNVSAIECEKIIRKNRFELEELRIEITRFVEDHEQRFLDKAWKEVNRGIEIVAKAYGYQIVFSHGEPEPFTYEGFKRDRPSLPRESQKAPAFVDRNVDITGVLSHNLRAWALSERQISKNSGEEKAP